MKTEPADAKKLKLLRYMNARLHAEGWETPYEFVRKSKVPFTMETCRKAFNECEYKRLGADTLAIILKYLNVPAPEIRRVLKEMTSDQELWTLLPEAEGQTLTAAESAWLGIFRKLKNGVLQGILGTLALVTEGAEDEIQMLQRGR